MSNWRPAHTLVVRVGPLTALPGEGDLRSAVAQQVTDRAAVLADALGLPLAPHVEVVLDELPGVELGFDGRALSASDLVLEEMWRLVAPQGLQPVPFGWDWQHWGAAVRQLADGPQVAAALIGEVVAHLLRRRPERLLTIRQSVAYLMRHERTKTGDLDHLDPEALRRIAAPALALGIGIRDATRVLERLANDRSPEGQRVESLVADLRSEHVDVLVGADLAAQIDTSRREIGRRFRMIHEEAIRRLGIRLPELRVVPDVRLPPRWLAVRINALPGRPYAILPQGLVMVDAPPGELDDRFGDAGPLRHPTSGARCAFVDARHAGALRAAGRLTWTPLDHVALAVTAEVDGHAAALVDVRTTEYELALLHREAPDLVLEALASVSVSDLTDAARGLLREGASVRNLRGLLERLIAFDVLAAPPDRAALDDGPLWGWRAGGTLSPAQQRLQFLRTGMRADLVRQGAAGRGRLSAIVVRDDVAERARQHCRHEQDPAVGRPLSRSEAVHLREAVSRIRGRAGDSGPPVLLTVGEARGSLASLLADSLPEATVLAFEELPHGMEVVTMGIVSFAAVDTSGNRAGSPPPGNGGRSQDEG